MQLKFLVYKNLGKFIVLSAVAALAVSFLQWQNSKNCDGSKEELGAWCESGREDREHKCSHNAVKSASRMMSMRERAAAPSVANIAHGLLEKWSYPCVLCSSKLRSYPWNSFNGVHTLCPHHTFHSSLHMHGPTVPKARATRTNPHMLVQRSLRCTHEAYTANTYMYTWYTDKIFKSSKCTQS